MSNFVFVTDDVLRTNLDFAFEHIIDLLALSESESYRDKEALVSSLRKTIIIHTASIIEAMLMWGIKKKCGEGQVELSDEWKYNDIKVLYKINQSSEIIGGTRKKVKKELNKLDFVRIIDVCNKQSIVKAKELTEDINAVRLLRNRLHIGGLPQLEITYKKKDLEFCFEVAKKVKDVISKI